MPHVVNGIGTWYYGKRRKHTTRGTCESCNRVTDLTSYDTTLFFTVLFVPLIPLAKKRVLAKCSSCSKHRVMKLADWERAKAADCGDLLDVIERDRSNRDAVLKAINFSAAYQDEPFLNNVVEAMRGGFSRDAEIQVALGNAWNYFANPAAAEIAYRSALAVEDKPTTRELLGVQLIKLDRPDEARPYLQHILTNRQAELAGNIYFLIEGLQSQGRHEEALAVIEERDAAFPQFADSKAYRKQRKTSARNQGTYKQVKSKALSNRKAGYREGGWGANLPRLIGPLIALVLLCLYLGSAISGAMSRKIFLANGTNVPYSVLVHGQTHLLQPYSRQAAWVPEGDVEVSFADPKTTLDPVKTKIETSFWDRPFKRHTFVINPDQAAVVLQEEAFYAENPQPSGPPIVHFGQPFYHIEGSDYEFEDFPSQLQVEQRQQLRKTRVAMGPALNHEQVVNLISTRVAPGDQIKLSQHLLAIDPNNVVLLSYLSNLLGPKEMVPFLEPRLDVKPILVEWHRLYQSLMEMAHPETDLVPRYRKLVADNPGDANALYLLGRATPDLDESLKLYQQAEAAKPPSGYPGSSLAFRALSEARFTDAKRLFEEAMPLLPDKVLAESYYRDALAANGDYDALLKIYQNDQSRPERNLSAKVGLMRVYAMKGDKAKAAQALQDAVNLAPMNLRGELKKTLEALLCCYMGDVAGYLKTSSDMPSPASALLLGTIDKAAELIQATEPDKTQFHGLIYLAAIKAGKKELAEAQWKIVLDDLNTRTRDERLFGEFLSGNKPFTVNVAQRLPITPSTKRVLVAMLAQRYPDQAKSLLDLSKKLDYQRDAISLCLAKIRQTP